MEFACRCLNNRITVESDAAHTFSPPGSPSKTNSRQDTSKQQQQQDDGQEQLEQQQQQQQQPDRFFKQAEKVDEKLGHTVVFPQLNSTRHATHKNNQFRIVFCKCCLVDVCAFQVKGSSSEKYLNSAHLLQGLGSIQSARLDPKFSKTYGILVPLSTGTSNSFDDSQQVEEYADILRERCVAWVKEEERKMEERIEKLIQRERESFNALKAKSVDDEARLLALLVHLAGQQPEGEEDDDRVGQPSSNDDNLQPPQPLDTLLPNTPQHGTIEMISTKTSTMTFIDPQNVSSSTPKTTTTTTATTHRSPATSPEGMDGYLSAEDDPAVDDQSNSTSNTTHDPTTLMTTTTDIPDSNSATTVLSQQSPQLLKETMTTEQGVLSKTGPLEDEVEVEEDEDVLYDNSDDDTLFAIEGFKNTWEQQQPSSSKTKSKSGKRYHKGKSNKGGSELPIERKNSIEGFGADDEEEESEEDDHDPRVEEVERQLEKDRSGILGSSLKQGSLPVNIPTSGNKRNNNRMLDKPKVAGSLVFGLDDEFTITASIGSLREQAAKTRAQSLMRMQKQQQSFIDDELAGSPPQ